MIAEQKIVVDVSENFSWVQWTMGIAATIVGAWLANKLIGRRKR